MGWTPGHRSGLTADTWATTRLGASPSKLIVRAQMLSRDAKLKKGFSMIQRTAFRCWVASFFGAIICILEYSLANLCLLSASLVTPPLIDDVDLSAIERLFTILSW